MEEGSFSVEAAIIMPIVIFAVLSLVFYGFFLRDIVLVETTGRALLIEEGVFGSGVGNEAYLNEKALLLSECLWWGTLAKWEYSEDCDFVEYEVSANIFGFKAVADNRIKAPDYFDTADSLRLWKSITEEAEKLIFTGGNTNGD